MDATKCIITPALQSIKSVGSPKREVSPIGHPENLHSLMHGYQSTCMENLIVGGASILWNALKFPVLFSSKYGDRYGYVQDGNMLSYHAGSTKDPPRFHKLLTYELGLSYTNSTRLKNIKWTTTLQVWKHKRQCQKFNVTVKALHLQYFWSPSPKRK